MPYIISNTPFATKQDIISKSQSILTKTKDNEDVSGEDYEFLIELFQNHDEWKEKSKNGYYGITAGKSQHGTRCFYLKTNTGLVDISFHYAIKCIKKYQA
ncbi:DUF3223 domain-containing protein [Salmonella enterica]|nr:DUF3223 domain-containing protein [Salmonella enterica]EKE9539206.1 DUF3223 domain-containing protein [Salmonella enterica]MBW4239475.1 DUF3223 domain-containing protein [Enterobacter roggenkampii]